MRALTYQGLRDLRVETVPDPVLLAPSDVIVAVRLAAICGSDLHVWHGRETGLDSGTVMGHEFLGEVVEVGRDVSILKRGDPVVSPFTTSCGVILMSNSTGSGWPFGSLGGQGSGMRIVPRLRIRE